MFCRYLCCRHSFALLHYLVKTKNMQVIWHRQRTFQKEPITFFGLLGMQRFDAWRTDSRLMFEIIRTNNPWHICSIPWIMFYYAYSPVVFQNPYIVVSKEKASISLCLHLKMRLSNGSYLSRPVSPRSIKNSLEMTASSKCKNVFDQNSDKYVLLHMT